jgi:hypothetical protein
VDTRVAKNIKLGEKRNLQLIFQAFQPVQLRQLWK